jgi:hypothetical protein
MGDRGAFLAPSNVSQTAHAYAGAIYHVMNRGDHAERIFLEDLDRSRFVATIQGIRGVVQA